MPAFQDGLKETEVPVGDVLETDVLVIGSGPAGGAAALFLAELGIPAIMVSKYVSPCCRVPMILHASPRPPSASER